MNYKLADFKDMSRTTKFLIFVFIVLVYVVVRLPFMGDDSFNTDVWKWKSRSYDFGSGVFGGDFEKTIQKYHPGVTLMWIGTFGVKIFNVIGDTFGAGYFDSIQGVFLLDFFQKLVLTIVIGCCLGYIFLTLAKYVQVPIGLSFLVLLVLDPFFSALTRVFHLEGLLSVLMFAAFVSYYDYHHSRQFTSLLLSGMFSGLAVLTKTSGLFIVLYVCLFILLEYRKSPKLVVFKGLPYLVISAIVFVLLWPAMWTHSALALETLYRGVSEIGVEREHVQFFFGKLVENPGVLFYPVVLLYRSAPQVVLLVIILFMSRRTFLGVLSGDPGSVAHYKKLLAYAGIYLGFFLLQLTIPTKKLDRYILPGYICIVFVASYGLAYLYLAGRKLLLSSILLYSLFLAILIGVDGFSYYNPLFGGLRAGVYVLEPKWLIGKNSLISHFQSVERAGEFHPGIPGVTFDEQITSGNTDKLISAGFQEKYYTQIHPYFTAQNYYAVIQDLTPHAKETNFFVYPVWDDQGPYENRFDIEPMGSVKLRGVTIYNVYKKSE